MGNGRGDSMSLNPAVKAVMDKCRANPNRWISWNAVDSGKPMLMIFGSSLSIGFYSGPADHIKQKFGV